MRSSENPLQTTDKPLRVAALVDLPRSAVSGGHIKGWERLTAAAASGGLPLDLTLYCSGAPTTEILGPNARIRQLPAVFSTSRLKFLPYVPDNTDLAPYHPALARELKTYDVLHTTDAFFAFAQTAERLSRTRRIPLVTSFHTDTPAYTRIFTRHTIEKLLGGQTWLARKLIDDWQVPERQGRAKDERLKKHLQACRYALVCRDQDRDLAAKVLGPERVAIMRLGVDKTMFGPHRRDRSAIEARYGIPQGRHLVLFVGRVDIGKNIYTLIEALERLLAKGLPMHLMTAGLGPAIEDVRRRLGPHASAPGFVAPDDLAQLYASVDVFALCSEVEIRSMAGVEALTSGCPVLVSEKSGVADLFDRTPAMLPVASGPEAWAQALERFVNTPGLVQTMRQEALAHSRDKIASWRDVLEQDLLSVWRRAKVESAPT